MVSVGVGVREPLVGAGWLLSVYPEAGEAGGSFRYSLERPPGRAGGRIRSEAVGRRPIVLGRPYAATALRTG